MASEIERKFLVTGDGWKAQADRGKALVQAYLASTDKASIRVRIVDDAEAVITLKSAGSGTSRSEFEYSIPVADARELMKLRRGRVIEKSRYTVAAGRLKWEIDAFGGDLAGLVIAEIELASADSAFDRPLWLGREITGDKRYYNDSLAAGETPERA
ncbi:MAG TPA: CYTH domain-containing protein [Pseudolabrys sp.]|jgi:adenylate cyclase|nr:CYTH domain-containing protein [Pseudolabrys sp.]